MFPAGAENGNGSSAPTGAIWVTTKAEPDAIIARIDATKFEPTFGMTLSMPIDLAEDYLVHIEGDGGAVGTNPFYYFFHSFGGSNVPEAEIASGDNDTPETAESNPEFFGTSQGGSTGAFVEGNLDVISDVDWFEFDIANGFGVTPDADWTIAGACSAQRMGSGLRNLTLHLETDGGTEIHEAVETADESATFGDMGKAFPSGNVTSLLLKVSANQQDPEVSSTHYRCGVVLVAPTM
jgi:hypothetical protein